MIVRPSTGRPHAIYWYILQTHSAAEIAFNRYLLACMRATGFIQHKNHSEKKVTLFNEATIFFKSGNNFEDLRAETLDGAVIDELRQQPAELWPVVIRPMLARRKGWCLFLSTTNGFDHTKDLYDYALTQPNEWDVFHAPSWEAWWWTPEEIASSKSLMSEDEFAQEIGAEFREFGIGKTYKNHNPVSNHALENPFAIRGMQWSPYLPIIVGLDFNVGVMCWELMQRKGRDFYIGDEIAIKNTDTEECVKALIQKIPKDHENKWHRPGLILIGDASGNSRKTSAAGETDYSIIKRRLKEAGIKFENLTPEQNPLVKDRINCMNGSLKAADGSVHLWYHPLNCPYLKADLERVKWKDGVDGAVLDKSDPLRTHASDAAGYPITYYSELLKKEVGTLQVVAR